MSTDDDMEDGEKPGSQPLRGVTRVEETSSPSQFQLAVTSAPGGVFVQYFYCFGVLFFLFLLAASCELPGKAQEDARWVSAAAGSIFVTLIVAMARVIGARVHTVTINHREVRSIWGRWTWCFALSEIKEIRTYRLAERGASQGVIILAQKGLPIPVYSRTNAPRDAPNSPELVCERLRFVVDKFTTSGPDDDPYR